jgi:hypothetical protein
MVGMGRGRDRPCRTRPADSVPGRGGPERRRRPRPDGTGTPDAHEIAHGTRHDTPGMSEYRMGRRCAVRPA